MGDFTTRFNSAYLACKKKDDGCIILPEVPAMLVREATKLDAATLVSV